MAGARCNVVWIRRGDFVWTLLGGSIDWFFASNDKDLLHFCLTYATNINGSN
jgi:hypothetical protein